MWQTNSAVGGKFFLKFMIANLAQFNKNMCAVTFVTKDVIAEIVWMGISFILGVTLTHISKNLE